MTPDPYQTSASASNPKSWNRYIYVNGDPANTNDPTGLYAPLPTGGGGGYDWDYGGAGASDGGLLGNDGDSGFGDGGSGNACVEPDGFTPMPNAGCPAVGGTPTPAPTPAPSIPTINFETAGLTAFLDARGSPLASDVAQLIEVGQGDDIDPTLLAAMAVAENGQATNNPFCVRPKRSEHLSIACGGYQCGGDDLTEIYLHLERVHRLGTLEW